MSHNSHQQGQEHKNQLPLFLCAKKDTDKKANLKITPSQ